MAAATAAKDLQQTLRICMYEVFGIAGELGRAADQRSPSPAHHNVPRHHRGCWCPVIRKAMQKALDLVAKR